MQLSTPSSVASSVREAVPSGFIGELPVPDVSDVWDDASDLVADSAVLITEHGGRLIGRTARGAWRHRSTVATVVLVFLAVVGFVALLRRSRADDDTE